VTATIPTRRSTEEQASATPPWRRVLGSEVAARVTSYVMALLLWIALAAAFERVPGPLSVVDALATEFSRGEVFSNFADTFYRFTVGVALAVVVGFVVGVLMGLSGLARAFFESPVLVGLSIPAIIWAFLTVMWFGLGTTTAVATTVLTATPFVAVNVYQGVLAISRDLRDMTSAYHVPARRWIRHLALPAIAGYVIAGVRFGVIVGWNAVLLAEWFGASDGVGFRARYWYDAKDYGGFTAWVILFIVFIVALDALVLERMSRRAFVWRDADVERRGA
jgi:NitT/TauT family transport system permease protein